MSPVWARGILGNGVTVCVVDDGLDYNHPDLKENFASFVSYDFNSKRPLPTPMLADDVHGTRCAGEIAAMGLEDGKTDISSNSWGPSDDGKTAEKPGPMMLDALVEGVTKGRKGLGIIYVFASGNGGSVDDCAFDGYVSNIYTIGIGALGKRWGYPLLPRTLCISFGGCLLEQHPRFHHHH